MTYAQVAVVLAFFGTVTQAYWRLATYRSDKIGVIEHFNAVRGLMEEERWYRPVRRLRRRREVMALLRDAPSELMAYRRVFWDLVAWVVLVTATLFAAFPAFGLLE